MRSLARPRDKADILARLRRIRPDSARRWGRMSAHQMICHLADALRLVTGEKPGGSGVRLHERTLLKWLVLYAPLRWPPGIATSPELDPDRDGTRPTEFAADLARVEALLERVTDPATSAESRCHPRFGSLSHATWLRWAWLHTDHHLRQFGV
jgi:hypothetical protein